jgi:hypothetical protein
MTNCSYGIDSLSVLKSRLLLDLSRSNRPRKMCRVGVGVAVSIGVNENAEIQLPNSSESNRSYSINESEILADYLSVMFVDSRGNTSETRFVPILHCR